MYLLLSQAGVRISYSHSFETGFGAHPASYPMDPGGSFFWCKIAGCVKFSTYLHLVSRSRMVELYLH
jgi:hypothetical protein